MTYARSDLFNVGQNFQEEKANLPMIASDMKMIRFIDDDRSLNSFCPTNIVASERAWEMRNADYMIDLLEAAGGFMGWPR